MNGMFSLQELLFIMVNRIPNNLNKEWNKTDLFCE